MAPSAAARGLLPLSVIAIAAASPGTSPPPHFVFTLVDDLGWNGLGFNGHNDEVKTPTIDALAKSGVICDNHYAYKFCSPTRASFLTGRIPGHGIQETNLGMTSQTECNANLTMVGKKLHQAGYYTAQIGKWHQGFWSHQFTPHGRGFNSSFGFLGGGEDHLSQCHGCENAIPCDEAGTNDCQNGNGWATKKFDCPAHYTPCGEVCPTGGGIDLYCTDQPCFGKNTTANPYLYATEATRLIRQQPRLEQEQPAAARALMIFLALHNVHQPVESPAEFVDLYPAGDYNTSNYARRIYNGMHSGVEFVVKNVTEELKSSGLWPRTIFILTADNGGTKEHGMPVPGSSNFPLRGHKYSWFEGGVRTATFVASPLLPAAVVGTTNHALLHISDWWATFATLAGLEAADDCDGNPSCPSLDGKDAWPVLTGATPVASHRTELLLGVGGPPPVNKSEAQKGALRSGPYKLIAPTSQADGWSAQYAGSTPYITALPGAGTCTKQPCLFNIEDDPRETKDLAETQPALTAKLFARYNELARAMYAPNVPPSRVEHGDAALDAAAAALEAPDACSDDDCWERKAHELQLRREAAAAAASRAVSAQAVSGGSSETGAASCWSGSGTPLKQLIAAAWHLGSADIFSFQAAVQGSRSSNAGDAEIEMRIVKGCANCAFTKGEGTITAVGTISLVAYGKGLNVTHEGALLANTAGGGGGCRIRWSSKTNHWADFCQGKPCEGGGGGGPPKAKPDACKVMLSQGGFWQPWTATPGWPLQ